MLIIRKVNTPEADEVIIRFLLFSLGFCFVGIFFAREFQVTLVRSLYGKSETDAARILRRAEYRVQCIP